MYRVSSRGNPWHDKLGRFCHGPEAKYDTWGNPINDEQRKEAIKYSELSKEKYKERTNTRLKNKKKELFNEENVNNKPEAKKYYSKNTAEDPPTPKQKRFAEAIAKRLDKELPEETKKGYAEFIAENVDEFYANKPKKKMQEPPIQIPVIDTSNGETIGVATIENGNLKHKERNQTQEEKPQKRPLPISTTFKMPTEVGKGQEGAIAFTKACAEAFGAKTNNVVFYSKAMGKTEGCVFGRSEGGKYIATKCVVSSKRDKNRQILNTYHEVFHLARNGHEGFNRSSSTLSVEETMAETAAITMCLKNGIKPNSNAYCEEIIRILPRLKQSDKYKDCNTISDFGDKFIADRQNGNISLDYETKHMSKIRFSEGKYFAQYNETAKGYIDSSYSEIVPKRYQTAIPKEKVREDYTNGMQKLKEGKTLKFLSRNERIIVSLCIRRAMEEKGIL